MFLSKYKKIFIGIGFFALVLIIGYLILTLLFGLNPAPEEPAPAGEKATSTAGLPDSDVGPGQIVDETGEKEDDAENAEEERSSRERGEEESAIDTVSESPVAGSIIDSNKRGVQYYNKNDGYFYRLNENDKIEKLSDKTFHNVENINWSPDKNKAVLEYPDGSNIIYDFQKEKQITIPNHWEDFSFSPSGQELAFKSMGMSPDNRWLVVSDGEGGGTRAIEKIGQNADKVETSWSPNNQIIGLYKESDGFDRQKINFIGKNNENFKSITVPGRGFEHKWSENGDKMLYSVYSQRDDMKPELWTTNTDLNNMGSGRKSLNVNTWAHKCTFSSDAEAYCGVPKELKKGDGLFKEKSTQTNDDLYKINIKTGNKELISDIKADYSMNNLQLSEDGKTLYFTDDKTEELHKIELE
jgi:hypothetical protein